MSDDVIYGWPECRYMSDGVMGGLSVVICQMTLYMRGLSVVIYQMASYIIWVA